jgi:WD40 repeat protein
MCTLKGERTQIELNGAYSVAVAPDGRVLAIGTTHGRVYLRAIDAAELVPLDGHTWTVFGLQFTPDGRQLVSASADGSTRVWDVARSCECHAFRWRPKWPTCLAMAPDGLTVATGHADSAIVVWDMPDD